MNMLFICMQYMGLVQDQSLTCIHYRQTCTLYVGGNELHTGIMTYTQECTRNACSNLQCMFSADIVCTCTSDGKPHTDLHVTPDCE